MYSRALELTEIRSRLDYKKGVSISVRTKILGSISLDALPKQRLSVLITDMHLMQFNSQTYSTLQHEL